MKVIITDRFLKKYLKNLQKYFNLEDFVESIKIKKHVLIGLKDPFYKFKNKISYVDFRGVLAIINIDNIIPLIIYLKKDKSHGENINWGSHEKEILKEYEIATQEIKKGTYKLF